MKRIVMAIMAISLINIPPALAKGRGGGGKSFRSSSYKSYSKPAVNINQISNNVSSSSISPSTSGYVRATTSSNSSNEKRVIRYAITNKKAGLTTCAHPDCRVVQYLPKDTKVELIESKNGFYLLKNGVQWISAKDII